MKHRYSSWMRRLLLVCILPLTVVSAQNGPLFFTSKPALKAVVGVKYEYKATVSTMRMTPMKDTVYFHLTKSPPGMSMDSVTGVLTWTPTNSGKYAVELNAVDQRKDKAVLSFTIAVANFVGTISGVVKNDSGAVLKNVGVYLFPVLQPSTNTGKICGVTDSLGKYSIAPVDSGSYYALATVLERPGDDEQGEHEQGEHEQGEDEQGEHEQGYDHNGNLYADVWYADAPTIASATPIAISTKDVFTANFTMHKRVIPVPASVSGSVVDTAGKPVQGATVVVVSAEKNPVILPGTPMCDPKNFNFQDPSFGFFPQTVFHALTDAQGKYTLNAYVGGPYIVAAFKKGYALQYYNGKSNAAEADNLTLSRDTSGINFTLSVLPKAVAKLSGKVSDSAGVGIPSRIVLYPLAPTPSFIRQTAKPRSIHTDSLGNFVMQSVANGKYFLQALPFKGYLPAFYRLSDATKADTITVNNNDISGLIIIVKKVRANGAGTISGNVMVPGGGGVAGVIVTAALQDQSAVNFAITDARGNFSIDALDQGSYMVSGDKLGYSVGRGPGVVIDYSSKTFSAQVSMNIVPNTAMSVGPGASLVSSYELLQNYPNPFNPSTTIAFSLPQASRVKLVVYDYLGREVQTLINDVRAAGQHEVQFNANSLASGLYIYRMTAGSYSSAKKMMLMK